MKVTLSTGVKITLSEHVNDDMELLELIGKLDNGDFTNMAKITEKIFGKDKQKVYNSIRRKDRTVPIQKTAELIQETFEKMGEMGKNFES